MTLRIRIIMIVALLLGIAFMFNLIRKRALELKYAIIWFILDVGLVLIVLIPGVLEFFAALLGITDVTNMIFFVGFVFSIFIIFGLEMSISRNSERVRKLTQLVALNEYEMRQKNQRQEGSGDL